MTHGSSNKQPNRLNNVIAITNKLSGLRNSLFLEKMCNNMLLKITPKMNINVRKHPRMFKVVGSIGDGWLYSSYTISDIFGVLFFSFYYFYLLNISFVKLVLFIWRKITHIYKEMQAYHRKIIEDWKW